MTSTIFDKNAYDDGIRDAIGEVTDDWAFRFPGIADVEHVYFYAATSAPRTWSSSTSSRPTNSAATSNDPPVPAPRGPAPGSKVPCMGSYGSGIAGSGDGSLLAREMVCHGN